MSLIFRMIYAVITSLFKPRLHPDALKSSVPMWVLPNDLDINIHMNNGRYLTICDLASIDIFLRTGIGKLMFSREWMPVISESTMKYKRPLKLFQKYYVNIEVVSWDKKSFGLKYTFTVKGHIVAEGTSKACIISKAGVINTQKVYQEMLSNWPDKEVA